MLNITFAVILLFSISSCRYNHTKVENSEQVVGQFPSTSAFTKDSLLSDTISGNHINGLGHVTYKFNVVDADNLLKSIFIYVNNKKWQEIIVDKIFDHKECKLFDYNFDGYLDICVRDNCGSGGCAYWIWNYSIKDKMYYYNKDLSEILGLEVDTINKFIIFNYRAGISESLTDTFQYINDKLTSLRTIKH